mgnify:CR=1 FL=1
MKQQLIALALSTALLAGSAAAIAPEEAIPRRQHLSRLCRCGRLGLVRRHRPDLL